VNQHLQWKRDKQQWVILVGLQVLVVLLAGVLDGTFEVGCRDDCAIVK
jgi:hypothetical protein